MDCHWIMYWRSWSPDDEHCFTFRAPWGWHFFFSFLENVSPTIGWIAITLLTEDKFLSCPENLKVSRRHPDAQTTSAGSYWGSQTGFFSQTGGWAVWYNYNCSTLSLFVNGGHHLCLTLQRFCPEPPRDTEKECQTRQPNNVQSLQRLRANLIHPWRLAAGQLRDTLSDLCRGYKRVFPPSLHDDD